MRKNISLPLVCALVVCAAVLMLGVDIWFRNEAGTHLLWFQNHPGFWDVLKYPGMIQHYRPVSFLMLSIIYHLFGPTALPFVLANFIGFLLTIIFYHLLVRHKTTNTVAFLSIMALFPLFYHVLYYPYNALHGIFYSWDVGWFCLALYLFMQSLEKGEKRFVYVILTALISLIALGTHGFAGLTLAIVMFAYVLFRFPTLSKSPWLISVAIVIPLVCLALIPILEPMGGQILKAGDPIFPQMTKRFSVIAHILMFPRLAPFLLGGITQTTVHFFSKKRPVSPLWGIAAAVISLVLQFIFPSYPAQVFLLTVVVLFLLVIAWKIGDFRVFALMGLLGLMHYFLVRGESSNYLRFLIFGIAPIMVFGTLKIGEGLLAKLNLPIPTDRSLPKWAVILTVLTLISLGLGLLDVPGFRNPVQKIRYLCHLSQTFHSTLYEGIPKIPQNSRAFLYVGNLPRNMTTARSRTQNQDIATMYTRVHLYNLRPAKVYEYFRYFRFIGRSDIVFKYVERGISLHPGETVYIIAFNIYEVLRTRTKFPAADLLFYVQKGRAEAAIFQLTAPQSHSELLLPPDRNFP